MRISRKICTVAFSTLLISVAAVAASEAPKYEITGSTNTNLTIPTASGGTVAFGLSTGVARALTDTWQLGTRLSFSTGTGTTSLVAMVGPTYNFGAEALKDTFYATAQGGLKLTSAGSTTTTFAYAASFGKRLAISDQVVWKPEVQVSGTTISSDRPVISLIPVQVSFFY